MPYGNVFKGFERTFGETALSIDVFFHGRCRRSSPAGRVN